MLEEGLAAIADDLDLCLKVMDLRAYARMKDAIEHAKKMEDLPPGVMGSHYWTAVSETTATLVKEAATAKKLGKKKA